MADDLFAESTRSLRAIAKSFFVSLKLKIDFPPRGGRNGVSKRRVEVDGWVGGSEDRKHNKNECVEDIHSRL